MTQTTNYGLNLPERSDYFNISIYNANFEILDEELGEEEG